jgi:hypothetical protein
MGLTSLAIRFAFLAADLARLIPAQRSALAPLGCAHAEMALEGAGEGGGRREATPQRDLEYAGVARYRKPARGPLEPHPADEIGQGLAGESGKDTMEMER